MPRLIFFKVKKSKLKNQFEVEFQFSLPCNHPSRQASETKISSCFQENRDSFPDLGVISGYESEKNFEELSRYGRTGLMVVYETLSDFESDLEDVLTCFGYCPALGSDLSGYDDDSQDYGCMATSPPGAGYNTLPGAESNAWFINSENMDDPGPAVHTLNVFICAKKGGSSDDELDSQVGVQTDCRFSCQILVFVMASV